MDTHQSSESQPITWKDVLRAIFLPPTDQHAAAIPEIALPHIDLHTEISTPIYALPDDLNTQAVINYENPPLEPISEVSAGRLATVGIGVIVAILVSYLASAALSSPIGGFGGFILAGIAGLLWLGILMFEIAPPDGGLLRRGPTVTGGGAARPLIWLGSDVLALRLVLGLLASALSASTYIFTANNTFTLIGFISWIVSVILWMLTLSERGPQKLLTDAITSMRALRSTPKPALRSRLVPLIAFLIIMGAAIFLRVYRLDAIPNEMTSDHVEKLRDSYDVSQGIYHVFFTGNGGREAFQFYLVPFLAQLLGTGMSFLSLKIATILEGLALIPLMILLGREVVDEETGVFSAGLVAISWWHIMLSRLALRIVLTPLVFTMLLIALIRAIRTGSRRSWLWAGVWLGLGVYAYQALRMAPLVALAAFGIAIAGPIGRWVQAQLQRHDEAPTLKILASNAVSRQFINLLCAGMIALALFIPMARVWNDFPNELWNRVINRTTASEVALQGSPLGIFVDNYLKALGMFNIKGDASWFSAVPHAPMLDVVIGGIFILGLVAWLVRLRVRRDPVDAFILVAGLLMLLPSALAIAFPIENPSTTRGSATLPIVFLIAAWPIALIRQRWSSVLGRIPGTVLSTLIILLIFAGSAFNNYRRYFVEYEEIYRRSSLNPSEVANAVREEIGAEASLDGVWLQGFPFWHDYRAIGIEAGDISFSNAIIDVAMLQNYLTNFPQEFSARPLVFIVHPDDAPALDVLQQQFPQGEAELYHSPTEGRDFILFVVRD